MSLLFILSYKMETNLISPQFTRPIGNPHPPWLLGNPPPCVRAVKHVVKATQYLSGGNPILLRIF